MKQTLKVSESEIKRVLADIDKDGDGTVNMKEYFANYRLTGRKKFLFVNVFESCTCKKLFRRKRQRMRILYQSNIFRANSYSMGSHQKKKLPTKKEGNREKNLLEPSKSDFLFF